MDRFIFDLQRFDTQTISAGESVTLDGVTYTAVEDATLNLDDNGKVSGLASGKVSAVVSGAESSPTITFDATDSAITFTATSDGSVISMTPFPIELISGDFTFKDNTINIGAGSRLASVNQSGTYSIRNEDYYEYGATYSFNNFSAIINSRHAISKFTLTNGSDVRELQTDIYGGIINYFTKPAFSLIAGSSVALNIGDYSLTTTAIETAGANIELGESGVTLTPQEGDGEVQVALSRGDTKIFDGYLGFNSGSITFGYDHAVTLAKDTSFKFTTQNNSVLTVIATDEATTAIALTDTGITFTPNTGDGALNVTYSKEGTQVFEGSLSISNGTIAFDATDKRFTISDGTKIQLGILGLELDIEVVGNTTVGPGMGANFKIDADSSGNLIFTPDENGGSFNIALKRDTSSNANETRNVADDLETFFENNATVNGPVMFNPQTGLLTLKDGTEISLAFDNYTLTATAQGDASSTLALTEDGISITPQQGDGTLKLTLGSAQGSMSVDLEVLSGGFVFGENGALNVVEGTEMQLTFSDNYSVKFKTTDDAGGALSIGADGLTFTPNSEDGGLELSVTRNGETRTASLDVTGSITYKLDGSISLAQGTVVKNVFEDGNILTITANTDASGSIVFNPQNGLTIAPSTADALTVVLTTGDLEVAQFSSITGTINYSGGLITASDGAKAHLKVYDTWETELSTTGGTASLEFTDDRTVYTANEGATFVLDYLDGTTVEIQNGTFSDIYATETSDAIELISEGSIFNCNDDEFTFTLEKAGNYTLNGIPVTTTSDNVQVQLGEDSISVGDITYTPLDENVKLSIGSVTTISGGKVSLQMEGFSQVLSFDTTDGAISYDKATGKFIIAQGTKSYIDNFADQFVAQGDFEISVVKNSDGTFTFSSDDTAALAIERNGAVVLQTTITLDGSIIADPANNQITVPKDTLLTMTPGDDRKLEIKALDDAGGHLSLVDGGIRFAPNENDGALELNFVSSERKVQLDMTGAFTYKGLGALALEDGTEATFTWEDGNILKLTSSGSTGSIGLDPNLGLKITSDDENLSMTFSTSSMSTDISGIKGTIYYNAGVVSFDENSKITATTTLGGQPIYTTLETIDGTGHISFNTTNGVLYSADTGALRITWTRDDLESTFTVNSGSVQIGHNLFRITEGSDIVTDLKTFVPALYFTTGDVGTYSINGQTITTTAEGLALTATDDQMVFVTSDDNAVEYDGMNFAGAGNVTLNPSSVVLGAGVEATGFGEDKSFVLAEAGNVTADAKIFELTKLDTAIEIPMEISVTGAQDGFTFSRTLTKESEAYLDDALNEEDFGNYSSSYIGQVFKEKFISAGDSSYRIRTDAIGLEEVIGISDGATVTGGASLGDEPTLSYYNLVTDTEGSFTIGEKTYSVSGDSSVAITARFEESVAPYASAVNSLNGTISGDFSGGAFKINGSSSLQVIGDSSIDIIADENGFAIAGLDAGASLKVSSADTYTVNETVIEAGASAVIVGTEEGKAQEMSNKSDIEILAETILKRTEAGYPAMAAAVFDPEGNYGDEPTNYADKEDWTITSADDLKLHAVHYTPENSNDKWVILIHGYGNNHTAMYTYAASYLANGYNVLMIDQRAAGESEGTWLTMGAAESADVALWTQEIASRNSNAKITLHGVSMGAATAMLAAARSDATNVTSIVEDCGYSNVLETFSEIVTNNPQLGISPTVIPYLDPVAASLTGYYLHDAAPIDSISSVKMPSLFISGDADSVAPVSMLEELYDASGADVKEKFIVEDAAHALAVFDDSIGYNNAVFRFVAEADEEGWVTTNTTDGISLRGTNYGDSITNKGTSVTIDAQDGNDYIENNVDSSLVAASLGNSINAAGGDDSIYSFHTYNPTLLGGEGADSIVVSHGHLTYIDGGADNDSILGIAPDDGEHEDYWGMGGYATVLGGEGDDYIDTGYSNNSSIDGGDGNDTIVASGKSATLSGGAGENLIRVTSVVADTGEYIVLAGNTTVEGFKTGFGEGSDTIYIDGDPAGVYFKDGGWTFSNSTDSLTLSNISDTAKVNIYHERRQMLNKGVFIADDSWYKVEDSDLTVNAGEEVYFVGPSANKNHGVDFSGISSALNVTMDTAYIDSEDYVPGTTMWINSVYSLKGGAGLTTITGSKNSDTIIAGGGETTINASAGDDVISLGSASALVQYNSGDGDDLIQGFNVNSTLQIGDGTQTYSTSRSGSDVIVTTGDAEITLEGAASLNSRHINGKFYVSPEALEKRIGTTPVATYTDEDFTNNTLDLTKSEGSQAVSLTSGNQTVKFNSDGGNVAVVEDGSGTKTIELGNGGDAVIDYANKGSKVDVTGGKGDDTIYTFGTAPVTFDMKNGGKDKISSRFNGETITLKNYKASLGGGIATGNDNTQEIVADIISENQMTFGDNKIELENNNGGSARFIFEGAQNYNIFNMFDASGEAQKIGFTNSDGGNLNVNKASDDYLLVGNYYGGKESSTITGGKGNDTLLGGGGDVLNAGGGENLILLADNDNRNGASIILNDGKTTIQNANTGFDDGDTISVDISKVNLSVENSGLVISGQDVHATVEGAENSGVVKQLIKSGNTTYEAIIAAEGTEIAVTDDDDIADYYQGEAVNFAEYSDSINVDLNDTTNFKNVKTLRAGSGNSTFRGGKGNDSLYAGTGTASIYGGGGRNFLANSSAEKDGATTFFVLGDADGARNTIDGFAFVTEDGIADKIEINTATNLVSDVRTSGDNVIIEVSNRAGTATERAVINGAVGQNMLFSDNVVAQVNTTTLNYDGTANYFVATDNNAAVNVRAGFANKAIIWLDTPAWAGAKESTFVGDIRTIDATASSVKAELAGNDANNTILAGSGDTSLWGGNGGDDLLIGGAGRDNFYYTIGNGDDTISGTQEGDTVFLTQVNIDQISGASVNNNVATINFTDGGKLTIQDADKANYVVTQGEEMRTYRVENGGFVQN